MKKSRQKKENRIEFGCRRGFHRFHQRLQLRDLCAGKPASCTTSREFLQCGVDIMDFNRLVEIDLAYEGSSVLVEFNQTKIVQGAKRTKAHRL